MNLLSIGAAFGVLVAIFQWGWLDGFLGFESQGALDTINVPLIFAVVFGLSMDYEVFLMSRIRERYMRPRRQRTRGRRGPFLERPHDLLGGADHDRGLRRLRPHRRPLDQGARPRLRGRDRPRRDPGAADPGPGGDEADGRLELVDALLAGPRCCPTSASRAAAIPSPPRPDRPVGSGRGRWRGHRVCGGGAAGGDGAGGGGLADRAGALYLERIERLDPQLNSFRKVFAERALLEAEQAEARIKGGDERPLLGVPIAIKDEVDVAGEINTHGTDAFTEPAKADAEMVRRLREAGAIVVGLTLLPEMAICGFTESATYGVTRNPWDPQRTPAGSSGGSAAAVAAGLVADRLGRRRRAARSASRPRPAASSASSPSAAASRSPPSSKAGTGWRSTAASAAPCSTRRSGSTSSPAARGSPRRPPPPERPFVEAARTPPGKLRVAWSNLRPARGGAGDRRRRGQGGGHRDGRAAGLARPRGRPARPRLGHDRQQHHPALPARRRRDRRRGSPPRASRTPHPRLRQARQPAPRWSLRASAAGRRRGPSAE